MSRHRKVIEVASGVGYYGVFLDQLPIVPGTLSLRYSSGRDSVSRIASIGEDLPTIAVEGPRGLLRPLEHSAPKGRDKVSLKTGRIIDYATGYVRLGLRSVVQAEVELIYECRPPAARGQTIGELGLDRYVASQEELRLLLYGLT